MPYSGSSFTLPPEDYTPNYGAPKPITYSQPAAAATNSFSLDVGGGGGGFAAPFRSPYSPVAPGSRGTSSTAAGGRGVPRGYSAYAWGQHLGREFAKKRLKDIMRGGHGKQFPMPPR